MSKFVSDKSIVLIGFMGTGKTTIGKTLASRLKWEFIDVDEEIEKEFQMNTVNIFREFGEEAFRIREKELIISYSNQARKIISVGGGAFLQKEVKDACMENCIVVHLDLSFSNWKERLHAIIDTRPVLQNKSIDDIHTLYIARQEIYKEHHYKLNLNDTNSEEAAMAIISLLEK